MQNLCSHCVGVRDFQKLNYSIPASNTTIKFLLPPLLLLPLLTKATDYFFSWKSLTKDNTLTPGSRLSNSANHSFNLWTSYEIQKGDLQGLGAGIGLFFVGDRVDFNNTYTAPSYFRTDASIFYKRDQFRVALNFKNLFDVDYFESSLGNRVYYGQPFTVQGTVSWQF